MRPIADHASPDRWHLMSYPRSGNHLVRTLIEVMSGRPTLGCPGNPNDVPIHLKVEARGTGSIAMRSLHPIAHKSHFLRHAVIHEANSPGTWGLIFLTRDPKASVASHAARTPDLGLPVLKTIHGVNRLRRMAKWYEESIAFYEGFDQRRRLHLKFEDLLDPDLKIQTIARLAAFLDLQPPKAAETDEIYALAKSAQGSLKAELHKRKRLLARFVPARLRYDRVLDRIAAAPTGRS